MVNLLRHMLNQVYSTCITKHEKMSECILCYRSTESVKQKKNVSVENTIEVFVDGW